MAPVSFARQAQPSQVNHLASQHLIAKPSPPDKWRSAIALRQYAHSEWICSERSTPALARNGGPSRQRSRGVRGKGRLLAHTRKRNCCRKAPGDSEYGRAFQRRCRVSSDRAEEFERRREPRSPEQKYKAPCTNHGRRIVRTIVPISYAIGRIQHLT